MKKLYTILALLLIAVYSFSQAPQSFNYQAVVRDGSGEIQADFSVTIIISIIQGTIDGDEIFTETHTGTTNDFGLITLSIGSINISDFQSIDWSAGPYFLKLNVNGNILGTTQLISVPYALYSEKSGNVFSGDYNDLTNQPTSLGIFSNDPGYLTSFTETDPVFGAWDKSTGVGITASQVSDFQTTVTNNASVLLNTAKVSNVTHTGDVTGSGVLTLANVNSDIGTFNNITINAKGLATAGSNVSYLTSETDPRVKAITGIVKSDGTTISAATAGTDYLTPTGSAELLTDFPLLNQNTTGSAASFTGSLAGEVTGTQSATVVTNDAVIEKVLTGYVSGAGTVATTDNILQAIQKLNGNDATNANLTGMVTSDGNETTVVTNADLTGEVTSSGNTTTITNNAVTNAKLGTVETATIKGRVTTGTGNVEDLTTAQVRTLLNVEEGANNYTHPTGDGNLHVPATGTTNSGKVLTAGSTAGSLSWETPTTGGSSLAIGDSYGGGIIFWLDASGQHGLIAATEDQSTSMRWYAGTITNTMAYADGVGAGKANTAIIIANQGYGDGFPYAARICNEYSVTVGDAIYGDWYLPSKYELNLLYLQKTAVGVFADNYYWSSTEPSSSYAWAQHFGNSGQVVPGKEYTWYVRAIRAF